MSERVSEAAVAAVGVLPAVRWPPLVWGRIQSGPPVHPPSGETRPSTAPHPGRERGREEEKDGSGEQAVPLRGRKTKGR